MPDRMFSDRMTLGSGAEIGQDRIEALQELEHTEANVVRLDQEIRDIQEEARRSGVPPGWLR